MGSGHIYGINLSKNLFLGDMPLITTWYSLLHDEKKKYITLLSKMNILIFCKIWML